MSGLACRPSALAQHSRCIVQRFRKISFKGVAIKEPIAIVGLGCRFPGGANSPRQFWEAICGKVDAITEVPPDRWNLERFYSADAAVPGTIQTRFGGFLDRIDQFDADFFGISPREAAALDPQQRLLLEVVWETLEDAGEVPERLRGSRTGVYVGCFATDYKLLTYSEMQRDHLGAHTSIGASATILSNRISHFFDFHGPSLSLDTACSSSMVAVHLACRSLWEGESELAVAGGVNLIFKPEWTIATSKGGFLSPDGRCKAFDVKANGYVRSEGIGAVLLKPLAQALADGNRVYAAIRETASNQDGRTNGITVPSKAAQTTLMETVYRNAAIDPAAVKYVEAHGTGTPTGDPIETGAIGAVFGAARGAENPCLIGSVKSNVGHLEAASGMAGLTKAALSLHHGRIPPNIHFETPNPNIRFADWKLRVVTEIEPFAANSRPRYVGVNSFGFGGSNVHIVLEGAESYRNEAQPASTAAGPLLFPLSAKNEAALHDAATAMKAFLGESDAPLYDIARHAALRREHHAYRTGLVVASREELDDLLDILAAGEKSGRLFTGTAAAGKTAFVFSGMGPQWWAMGRQLLEREPVFRAKIEECDTLLARHADWSLLAELTAPEERSRIDETRIAQPAIFAVQVALAALLASWDVVPDAIVGHSAGEVAAAHVSGALSLEDAVRVIFHRSRLQSRTEGQGRILAAGLPAEDAQRFLEGREHLVSLGAVNSPGSCALAGDEAALDTIAAELARESIFCKKVYGKVPYHSPAMDPLKAELDAALAGMRGHATTVPLYSTVTGAAIDGEALRDAYWFGNIRNTVLFATAIDAMRRAGCTRFVEISPHPALSTSVRECLDAAEAPGVTIPTLRRNQDEKALLLGTLAQLYASGAAPNWQALYPHAGVFVELPHYPWQRERHWVESEASLQYRLGHGTVKNFSGEARHPLLGARLHTGAPLWDLDLDLERLPFLADHKVREDVVYPGAAYVEAALAAARELAEDGNAPVELADLEFSAALYLAPGQKSSLQFALDPDDGRFKLFGRSADQPWVRHAAGRIARDAGAAPANADRAAQEATCPNEIDRDTLYRRFAEHGLRYGPAFQAIRAYRRGERAAAARLELPEGIEAAGYHLHPLLLDAAFQAVLGILDDEAKTLFLPVRIERVRLFGAVPGQVVCHAELTERSADRLVADLTLFDPAGVPLAEVRGFACKALGAQRMSPLDRFADDLYQYRWEQLPPPAGARAALPRQWLVLGGESGIGEHLAAELASHGDAVASRADALEPGPWGLLFCGEFPAGPLDAARLADLRERNEIRLLQALQAAQGMAQKPALLCLATQGLASAAPSAPLAASLWGMGRVAMNEFPDLRCLLADLDATESVPALVAALAAADGEDEIALMAGKRHVRRLHRVAAGELDAAASREAPAGTPYFLTAANGFAARAAERRAPADGEVEIEIHAAGFAGAAGTACAGVVQAVGAGAARFQEGDEVIVLAADCLRSHFTVDARLAAAKPANLAMAEAAGAAHAYAAAWLGLARCAAVQTGERVLVEDDPDGIGLAALQVARARGARVHALAGDAAAARRFADLGAEVLAPAAPGIIGRLREAAGGRGFDVVCRSTPGQATSPALLAPFGRFVDFTGGDRRAAADGTGARNLAWFRIDMAALAAEQPELVGELLKAVGDGFARYGWQAPALPVYSAARLTAGDRPERGIVLLRDTTLRPLLPAGFQAKGDAVYLVTGGVRGFGLSVAAWLAQRGARHLVLLGRSATLCAEALESVESLRRAGVEVRTEGADVADPAALARVFRSIAAGPLPLRGIVHAANVYDDTYLAQMSAESFRRVYDPKALGAWNLHALSHDLPLDFFVLFSSISAVIGNPGQANYVAGNGFLTGLSALRRAQGLPALAVNWGAIAEVGYLARNQGVGAQLKDSGITPLPPDAALDLMGELLGRDIGEITVADVSWRSWLASVRSGKSPRFAALRGEAGGQTGEKKEDGSPLVDELLAAAPKKRQEAMERQLLQQVAAILGMGKTRLPSPHQGFTDLGMDSMLAVELRNRLQKSYRCTLPATLLFLHPTVEKLAGYFLGEILAERFPPANHEQPAPPSADASLDELATLLERKLAS